MKIKIAERLKPISHLPGTYFVLPGSTYRIQFFPGCMKVDDLSTTVPQPLASVVFDVAGPVREFTVEQDLERGVIHVWAMTLSGFMRYHVAALENTSGIAISFEKIPKQGIKCTCDGVWKLNHSGIIQSGVKLNLSPQAFDDDTPLAKYRPMKIDRLSLGNHKGQDWELMRRRRDFAEIFPIWHRLGQLIPSQKECSEIGVLNLLNECRQAMRSNAPEKILPHFERLFLAGFEGALSPRLRDYDFQGIGIPDFSAEAKSSPLELLTRGSELIRQLFVQYDDSTVHLLPALPTEFHCGRFLDVNCGNIGSLSMEWTKKATRSVNFTASRSQTFSFIFSLGEKRCRLRKNSKDRGVVYSVGTPIEIINGQNYWFDNFER